MSSVSSTHPQPPASQLGVNSSSFADTVRSEAIKVRTVVSFPIMAGLALAFPILLVLLSALFGDDPFAYDFADSNAGYCVLPAMVMAAFGVTALTSEYGHNTIRVTYAATPNRLRVHLAKLLTVVIATGVVVFVAYVVCWMIARVADSRVASLFSSDVLGSLFYTVLMAGLVALFAYAIGLNLRNSAASVTVLLLWPFVVENLLMGVLFVIGVYEPMRFMPYLSMLSATTSVEAGTDETSFGLPWSHLYFFAFAAGLWALGMYRESNRDA